MFLRNLLYDCMKLNFGTNNMLFLKSFWFLTLPAGRPKNLNMEQSKRSSILRNKICRNKTQRIVRRKHAFHTRNPLVLCVRCLPVSQAIPWRATQKNKRVQKVAGFNVNLLTVNCLGSTLVQSSAFRLWRVLHQLCCMCLGSREYSIGYLTSQG